MRQRRRHHQVPDRQRGRDHWTYTHDHVSIKTPWPRKTGQSLLMRTIRAEWAGSVIGSAAKASGSPRAAARSDPSPMAEEERAAALSPRFNTIAIYPPSVSLTMALTAESSIRSKERT